MEQALPQTITQTVINLERELRQHYATNADLLSMENRLIERMDRQLKWQIMANFAGVAAVAAIIGAVAAFT